jgi:hypothetical protein
VDPGLQVGFAGQTPAVEGRTKLLNRAAETDHPCGRSLPSPTPAILTANTFLAGNPPSPGTLHCDESKASLSMKASGERNQARA